MWCFRKTHHDAFNNILITLVYCFYTFITSYVCTGMIFCYENEGPILCDSADAAFIKNWKMQVARNRILGGTNVQMECSPLLGWKQFNAASSNVALSFSFFVQLAAQCQSLETRAFPRWKLYNWKMTGFDLTDQLLAPVRRTLHGSKSWTSIFSIFFDLSEHKIQSHGWKDSWMPPVSSFVGFASELG